MGRLGRYEGNVMTYVRASNNKLIDRSIRYIDLILRNKKISPSYDDIAHFLFEMVEKTPADQSIVLATVEEIKKSRYREINRDTCSMCPCNHLKCSELWKP